MTTLALRKKSYVPVEAVKASETILHNSAFAGLAKNQRSAGVSAVRRKLSGLEGPSRPLSPEAQ